MDYFTSDTHFGHANIIKYCNRPFADVHHMNVEMTTRWNARVLPEDRVYHIGDFAMGHKSLIPNYLKRLNGEIIFIAGNHDRPKILSALGYAVYDELKLPVGLDKYVYLCHKPYYIKDYDPNMLVFLCGHVHETWKRKEYQNGLKQINVGVDQWDFTPHTLDELIND